MLIVSKFHDYYDSAVGQGIDKTVVYDRKTKEIPSPWEQFGINLNWGGLHIFGGDFFSYSKKQGWSRQAIGARNWFIIGFCGKTYLGLQEIKYKAHKITNYAFEDVITYYYGEDALQAFANVDDDESRYHTYQQRKNDTLEFIRKVHEKEHTSTFFEYNAPIFVISNLISRNAPICEINAKLKDWQFFKEKETFIAFQEIQSFISGVLGINRELVALQSDKEKILSHGLDLKWSFRKPGINSK